MPSAFRTEIRKYWIYCILEDVYKTAFVGKSFARDPRTHFYSHLRGEHALTREEYFDTDITKPKFYILECILCTGATAFKHILAWYHFFEEMGYAILTEEKVGFMVDNMGEETQKIYQEVCAPHVLYDVVTREVVEPVMQLGKNKKHLQGKEENEALVQLNIRVKESVAQAYRSYCKGRKITQSDGLRLLLMGDNFESRNLLMQSYQKDLDDKGAEISRLKDENKELLAFKRGEESWALHQHKEWTKIIKECLNCVVDKAVTFSDIKGVHQRPLAFKNSKGYALFHKHQYPSEGGCFEITVKALVWGLSRNKTTPDRDTCLFVCGLLKDHTPIKFRWYLKQPLIGVYPNDLALAHWGDSWLMGCIIAKDGAANLAFAIPMNSLPASPKILTYEDTFLTPKTGKTATSLDEKIAAANRKSTAD